MTHSSDGQSTQEFIRQLMSPERGQQVDTFRILSMSGINLHDTVADVGCGPGFFTVPLSKYLVSGKVYALDIDDEMLDACSRTVQEARMGNVEVLKCGEFDFPLEENSVDGAFLAFVVQHSPDKARFLGAVRQLIHAKGWCTVLEWYRKETGTGPPQERRVDPLELQALGQVSGFRYGNWRDLNGEQYMMTFRRD